MAEPTHLHRLLTVSFSEALERIPEAQGEGLWRVDQH